MSRAGAKTASSRPLARTSSGVSDDASVSQPAVTLDGRARRWESHRASRRYELTRLARKAIHRGGPDLSMDEIAAAMGTSKSIVYRYFADRSGLQRAVGEAVLADLGTALAEASRHGTDPTSRVRAMVSVYLEMLATSPSVYSFVSHGGDVADAAAPIRTLADDAARLLVPSLEEVLRDRQLKASLAPMWAAGVIGFVRGAAEVWLVTQHQGDTEPLMDFTEAITDWICQGIDSGSPRSSFEGE